MRHDTKRYAAVIILCIAMDLILKQVSYYTNTPLYLDCTGTALAAVVLEPAAGLLVGLANNFFIAIAFNGPSAILYYSVSAAFALLWGNLLVKNGKVSWRNLPLVMALTILSATVLSATVSILRDGVVMSGWEGAYQIEGMKMGMNRIFGAYFGVLVVETYDIAATAAIVAAAYCLLPKSLKARRTRND